MQKFFDLNEEKEPKIPDLSLKNALDDCSKLKNAGLLIDIGYIVVDFDGDNPDEEKYIEWIKQEYPTTWVKTKKGTHFYYKIPKKYINKWSRDSDVLTWIGLQADFLLTKKVSGKDKNGDPKIQKYAYAMVKQNDVMREHNAELKFDESLPELPRVLYPVKIKTKGKNKKGDKSLSIVGTEDVTIAETGEGNRDNVLYRQLMGIHSKYPDEEFLDIALLMNKMMFIPPYDDEYIIKKYKYVKNKEVDLPTAGVGRPKKDKFSIEFLRNYLSEELKAQLYYDVISKKAFWKNLKVCREHQIPTYIYDQLNDMSKSSLDNVRAYLNYIAFENERNYILEQIISTHWDGEDRLKLIYEVLGVTDSFEQTLILKWMWQSLTLLHNREKTEKESGLGADGCLVFQGNQGIGKTEFFKYLCSFAPNYFLMGAELKFDNKDTVIKAIGNWIVELGEVEGTLKKSEVTDLKNFITADEDIIRLPYGRETRNSPRMTSFCASCNSSEFLRDETGNRRFWIVQIKQRINRDKLYQIDVLQLWKQVYDQCDVSFENQGFRLAWSEQDENTNRSEGFQVTLKGEDEVKDKIFTILNNENYILEKLTVTEWMEKVGGFNKCSAREVGKVLTKMGYESEKGTAGARFRVLPIVNFKF